jgi:hypothetical protein
MRLTIRVLSRVAVAGLVLGPGTAASWAQAPLETFTATASAKSAAGDQKTAPVTIVLTRQTTDDERAAVGAALKKDGTAGVVTALKGMADAGYIEVGERRTTLKYAYTRAMGGGRLITVIAPTPIAHLGANLPNAPPKAGFDLALAILEVKASGPGTGELAPAATVKMDDSGAIQTKDYGAETVWLNNIQSRK